MQVFITKNSIILPVTFKKGTEVRVYFERVLSNGLPADLPIATLQIMETSSDKWNEVEWNNDFKIRCVEYRKTKFFGMFGREWKRIQHILL